MMPYGDRSGAVIEPWLTDQWFVDAQDAGPAAIEAVKDGRTRFVPKHWENTYFEWMNNIQPWCISRQIWWGHQVRPGMGRTARFSSRPARLRPRPRRDKHYGKKVDLRRDADVLDTWFSSALWPFPTLGWPAETAGGQALLPDRRAGDRLRTIIFFWVARMMMAGLHFMGGRSLPHRLHPCPGPRRRRARRCRSPRATSSTRWS